VACDLFFNLLWMFVAPLDAVTEDATPYPLTYVNCDGKSFTIWAGVSYVEKGLFLFYGVFLAVMTRGLPSAYGEAAYIGLSIYNIAFSACLALPIIYLVSSQDTLTGMFVLTSLAIIWTVLATYLMLIVPRLYYFFKQIAPDQRFLDEKGYDTKRGKHQPRDMTSRSPAPFSDSRSLTKMPNQSVRASQTTKTSSDHSTDRSTDHSSDHSNRDLPHDNSNDNSSHTSSTNGLLEIHQSMMYDNGDDEGDDVVIEGRVHLMEGPDSDDYVQMVDHSHKIPPYNKSDVMSDSQTSELDVDVGHYVPPNPQPQSRD